MQDDSNGNELPILGDPPVMIKDGSFIISIDSVLDDIDPVTSSSVAPKRNYKRRIKPGEVEKHIRRVVVMRKNETNSKYRTIFDENFDPQTCKIKIFWEVDNESGEEENVSAQ